MGYADQVPFPRGPNQRFIISGPTLGLKEQAGNTTVYMRKLPKKRNKKEHGSLLKWASRTLGVCGIMRE